ncbi:ornithine cyclodeaminase family protein [Acuticoccus kandeliae]|uniref:ornithine cyclodeaminase family protein n=1 Tax=Acuticoccus kandeliae TaxID=2073160 RepID=UPI000D3EB46C|nr:ornithine cyclodeaminase family protein [Acuticoccus kandeliae]
MIVLSEADIASLLTMEAAIEIIEKTMIAVSSGTTTLPLRMAMPVGGPNMLGVMPGAMHEPGVYGVKLISLFPHNPDVGLSSHRGAMVIFEPEHGAAIGMMNAGLLTAIRTSAASAVATRALARKDAATLTLIGTGEQAEHHLAAITAVRPIRTVRVAGRRLEKAEAFCAAARAHHPGLEFTAGTDIRAAVDGADIVCTVTSAADPVLLGAWLAPGTHLNIVGASIPSKREIDEAALTRSSLFVDYRPSTFAQAGEVIAAIEAGVIGRDFVRGEIGEVLSGAAPGRTSADEITLYRSLGIAAQDLACAHYCVNAATARGLGVVADLE